MTKPRPVRYLSKQEIATLNGEPTLVISRTPKNRTAAEQIQALLKLTDNQLSNLENAGLLSNQEMRQLSFLVDTVVALHKAQLAGGDNKDDPDRATDEQLKEVAGQ
jgi:hypothetical protein